MIELINVKISFTAKLNTKVNSNSEKKILFQRVYENHAWGKNYSAIAIFDDGTMYTWNYEKNNENVNLNDIHTREGLEKILLDNGKYEGNVISKENVEKLKEYIEKLEDSIEVKHLGADQGTTTISVWKANDKKIDLIVEGDGIGENKTDNSQEILKIVGFYNKN